MTLEPFSRTFYKQLHEYYICNYERGNDKYRFTVYNNQSLISIMNRIKEIVNNQLLFLGIG